MVSLGQKIKIRKTWEKPLYKIIRMFLCKKPLEKATNIGEMRQFRKSAILQMQNRPCCKGYSPCKVYSLCKMVSLGQKLKMPNTCEKPFYKIIRVFLCKTGTMNSTNWPAPSVCVFIAQLVEHCSANAEAMGLNPVGAPKTFFGLNCGCLNCNHNRDDHTFIPFVCPQFT